MKKLAAIILAVLVFPVVGMAGEMKATIVKVDKVKNQAIVRTDKGEQTLDLTGVKGGQNAKEGAQVMIMTNDKDGKVSEIAPGAQPGASK